MSLVGANVQTRSAEITFGTNRRSEEEVLECELKLSKYDRDGSIPKEYFRIGPAIIFA